MLQQLQLYQSYWQRLRRAPNGHPAFLTAILALRVVAVFGLVLRFGLNREIYAGLPVLWNAARLLLAAYFGYLILLAALRLLAPARFHSPASRLVQIGVDVAIISGLYYLTMDLAADLFLLYYFPLLVAAEYFQFAANAGLLAATAAAFGGVLAAQAQAFGAPPEPWGLTIWMARVIFLAGVHLAYLLHRRLQMPSVADVDAERAVLWQAVRDALPGPAAQHLEARLASYTRKVERTTELQAAEWRRKNKLVTRQLKAIFKISEAATADEDEAVQRLVEELGEALGCQAGALRLVGQNARGQQSLVLRAAYGYYLAEYWQEAQYLDLDQRSQVVEALKTRQTIVVADVQAPTPGGRQVHYMEFVRSFNLHGLVCVPLFEAETPLGTLSFYRDSLRPFEPDEVQFIKTLANYLVLRLANWRHYQATLARAQERKRSLDNLYELSDQLTSFGTLEEMLAFVVSTTRQQLQAEVGSVFLAEEGRLRRRKCDPLADTWFSTESYAVGEGLTGKAALASEGKAGSVVRVDNVDAHPDVVGPNLRRYAAVLKQGTVQHLLAVPLSSQRHCFGVLRLLNKQGPNGQPAAGGFSEADANVLYTIGCQVGVAIQNMRLIEAVRHEAEQAGARARDLAALHAASQVISGDLDYQATLVATCREARRLFQVDHVGLVLFDHEHDYGQVVAEDPLLGCLDTRIPLNVQAERRLIATGQPIYLADVDQAEEFGPVGEIFQRLGLRSTVLVPFRGSDGRVLGSFSLDGIQHARTVTQGQLALSQTFASQVSLAIQNARLFETERQQQARLRSFVAVIGEKLVEHTDLAGLYAFTVHSGAQLLDAEDCSLFVVDDDTRRLHFVAASHLPAERLAQEGRVISAAPRAGLTAYVAATGQALSFVGSQFQQHAAWSGVYTDHLPYFVSAECRSLLLVAMQTETGRIVGVLKAENRRGANPAEGFSSFDQELLKLLATQVAKNIERLRQYAQLSRAVAQRERARLQGELHDALNVFHSAVMLEAEVAQAWLKKGQADRAAEVLRQMWRAARYTYGELSNILQDLRDPILRQHGLAHALRHYAELVGPSLVTVSAQFEGRLAFDTEYALFRIAQGAISNSIKHAGLHARPDGHVWLEVEVGNEHLRLLVRDNGRGFEEQSQVRSLGLARMRSLADDIGASLTIDTQLGAGTKVAVELSLREVNRGSEDPHTGGR